MAAAMTDADLLRPQSLVGDAVERDRSVKDQNHAPVPDEQVWWENATKQSSAIAAAEQTFFDNLRGRMK